MILTLLKHSMRYFLNFRYKDMAKNMNIKIYYSKLLLRNQNQQNLILNLSSPVGTI